MKHSRWIELDLRKRILQVCEPTLRRHIGGAEALGPIRRSRSGVFCRSCEHVHSVQVCGVSFSRR